MSGTKKSRNPFASYYAASDFKNLISYVPSSKFLSSFVIEFDLCIDSSSRENGFNNFALKKDKDFTETSKIELAINTYLAVCLFLSVQTSTQKVVIWDLMVLAGNKSV